MNENPEGTPNPLNPSAVGPEPVSPMDAQAPAMDPTAMSGTGMPMPAAQPVAPVAEAQPTAEMPIEPTMPMQPEMPAQPTMQPEAMAAQPVQPAQPAQPGMTQPAMPQTAASEMEQLLVTPVQPVAQPTTEAPVAAPAAEEKPKKKSKTSLIVTLIVFLVALIGCAVAAILIFDPFGFKSDDRVPTAISRLFQNGAPKNVAMNGSIAILSNDEDAVVPTLNISYTAQTNTESTANSANATVTAIFADESEFSFGVDEIHSENGDLYLKLSGFADALIDYDATNCESDESGETNCGDETGSVSLLESLGVLELIDDQWVMIPANDYSVLTDMASVNAESQCLIDAAGKLSQYGTDFSNAYQNNQFITYSTDNLTIAKRKDNLYRLTIDADKFAGFINSMSNSGFMNELNSCMGNTASNATVVASDLTEIVKAIPTIYVEINDNYQFTRVYLKAMSADKSNEAIVDMTLSYPSSITIDLPNSYVEYTQVLNLIFPTLEDETTEDVIVEEDVVVEEVVDGEVVEEEIAL